ncbi:MAG: flagellar hook-length control protein FliK [Nitrospirota bacterium]
MQPILPINPGQQPVTFSGQGVAAVSLVLGEVVRGEVLNILPGGISMRVNKEIFLAHSDIPLQKGESYLFSVESLMENGVKLKVLQALVKDTPASSQPLLPSLELLKGTTLSHNQLIGIQNLFSNLPESVLKQIPNFSVLEKIFKNINSLTDGTLKESVEASGGSFESKLRAYLLKQVDAEGVVPGEEGEVEQLIQNDLKGSLLKVKQELVNQQSLDFLKEVGVKVEELSQAVDKLLTHIEQQQLTSKLDNALQTFLPFIWEGLKDGRMTFKESYHPREGELEQSCVIALDLEKAGKLITHVRLFSEDQLHLRFITENPALSAVLEENKPLLEKQLHAIGITCNSLVVTEEKIIDLESATSLFELDIKV